MSSNLDKCHCCGQDTYESYLSILHSRDIDKHSNKAYIHSLFHYAPSIDAMEDSYMCLNPLCKHTYRNYKGDIKDFHKNDYRAHQLSKSDGFLDMGSEKKMLLRRKRFQMALRFVISHAKPKHNILEIASGRGYFLTIAKNYFKSATGMDIDPKTKVHNSRINPEVDYIVCDFLEMPEDKKYDVIFAFDVLEHIENIKDFPKKIHKLGEKVVIQVPVNRPIIPPNLHLLDEKDRPIYRDNAGNKLQTKFDGHLHYFTENSLHNLFTKDNLFKCVFCYTSKAGELAAGQELLAVYEKIGD